MLVSRLRDSLIDLDGQFEALEAVRGRVSAEGLWDLKHDELVAKNQELADFAMERLEDGATVFNRMAEQIYMLKYQPQE
jgi:hypothetical protein